MNMNQNEQQNDHKENEYEDYARNIFTFDQDDDEKDEEDVIEAFSYQQSTVDKQRLKDNLHSKDHNKVNKNRKSLDENSFNEQIFQFDENEKEKNFKQTTQSTVDKKENVNTVQQKKFYRNETDQKHSDDFTYLKNKILFREQNNFFDPQQSHYCSPKLTKEKIINMPDPITNGFEKKVRKIQEGTKQNQISSQKQNKIKLPKEGPKRQVSRKQSSWQQKNQKQFQEFEQNQSESNRNEQGYKINGAKILTQTQPQGHQFQYLEEQKAIKVTNLKEFLFTGLSQQYKVNALIRKVDEGGFLGKLVNKTKYFVTIQENNKFLFSVTKDGLNRFFFSINKEDCSLRNKNYLGQLISKDFSNTEFILYDWGFDHKQTKCLQFSYKQLAWIKYEESAGPRKFSVTLSTNNKGFHCLEDGLNIFQQKWDYRKERKDLCKLYSKQPEFDQADGNYKLDFKGVSGKPSIKNFVLSSQKYEECLIFARRNQNTYGLQIKSPFSLIQAVAVCISSIHHKTVF